MANQQNKNLPEYNPPSIIWQKIEANLNADSFQKGLSQMPNHEPKEQIWLEIEKNISQKNTPFITWKWLSLAASIAIFIGFVKLYNTDNQTIKYSQEQITTKYQLNLEATSDKQYQQIIAFCKQETKVCQNPEFRNLKTELDDLQSASQELKNAIGKYNTEPELLAQLEDVELQKIIIIKKMALKI